jgi:uncharacterized protein YdhG (YjbR/CyaY superfamily)
MRKGKNSIRSSSTKTAVKNVDEYLKNISEPARSTLNKIREAIRSAVPPEAVETISYGMPAFKYKRVLVWYAALTNHCSLFPTASIVEEFKKELQGYSISKEKFISQRKSLCRPR